jgi:hypothetical protein
MDRYVYEPPFSMVHKIDTVKFVVSVGKLKISSRYSYNLISYLFILLFHGKKYFEQQIKENRYNSEKVAYDHIIENYHYGEHGVDE